MISRAVGQTFLWMNTSSLSIAFLADSFACFFCLTSLVGEARSTLFLYSIPHTGLATSWDEVPTDLGVITVIIGFTPSTWNTLIIRGAHLCFQTLALV